MSQRTVLVPEIGEVILAKRKNAKYLRLTVTSTGKVRVGMPKWTPYSVGINFAIKRREWIKSQQTLRPAVSLINNSRVGKSYTLYFLPAKGKNEISSRVSRNRVDIFTDLPVNNPSVQQKASLASEKALLQESKILLPQRLSVLATKFGYSYNEVKIKKLLSRWGSCSSDKVISLSYYLIQLPWPLIDYVLLHELVHTRHLNHGAVFWRELKTALPNARNLQKEIKAYNPRVEVS